MSCCLLILPDWGKEGGGGGADGAAHPSSRSLSCFSLTVCRVGTYLPSLSEGSEYW